MAIHLAIQKKESVEVTWCYNLGCDVQKEFGRRSALNNDTKLQRSITHARGNESNQQYNVAPHTFQWAPVREFFFTKFFPPPKFAKMRIFAKLLRNKKLRILRPTDLFVEYSVFEINTSCST